MLGKKAARRGARGGFTLLELLFAVLLSAIIAAGLYQVFSTQSQQLAFLDLQTEMHQNLRFATDIVTRTLRNAGLGTSGFVTGVLGYGGDADEPLPAVRSYDAWGSDGSDAISLVYMDPSLLMDTDVTRVPTTATTSIYFDLSVHNYDTLIQNYSLGDFLLCNDFANLQGMESYMWIITGVTVSGDLGLISVAANNGYADYQAAAPTGENLAPVLTCSKGQVVTFYIDSDGTDGIGPGSSEHPVLMMDMDDDWPENDDVPLVDDIEDMQFAYCLENTDCSNSSNWVDSLNYDDHVWMVRVSLVARSSRGDLLDLRQSSRPALENHSASTSTDGYYREVLTTTVTLRNLRYYSVSGNYRDYDDF